MSGPAVEQLRSYLGTLAQGGIEEIIAERPRRESLEAASGPGRRIAEAALEKLARGSSLSADERFAVEAIIIPDKRPAIDIRRGTFEVTHELWRHFGTDPRLRANIEKAIRSVGRVELPGHPQLPYGGTAFVVGKGLLMTNRHVAEIFTAGLGVRGLRFIEGHRAGFDPMREIDSPPNGRILDVRAMRMVHPYWDMALLAVEGLDAAIEPLRLAVSEPPSGRDVAVIGYPAFDPRNNAAVQLEVFRNVFDVKRLQPGKLGKRRRIKSFEDIVEAVTHDSSTLGGNSGSAVIDVESGEVVALHFAGLYLDANFGVPSAELARDGRVVDAGVTFAGRAHGGVPPWDVSWRRADGSEQARAAGQAGEGGAGVPPSPPAGAAAVPGAAGDVRIIIPLEVTVRLGAAQVPTASGGLAPVEAEAEELVPRQPFHDTDYSNRRGFDANLLGLAVELPVPEDADVLARTKDGGTVLDYNNFTVMMHAERRLALVTASNVTTEASLKQPEPGRNYSRKGLSDLGPRDIEQWFLDPRMEARFQLPDVFFTQDRGAFDKGHLVRREDVAWGRTYAAVKAANGDTYHVTNCSPQVKGFNQSAHGVDNWGDLENHVLAQAGGERLCVLAGPVLSATDPIFVGKGDGGAVLRAKIPERFWKVVVARTGGALASFAFILEQDLSRVPTEFVVDEVWRRKLVPVSMVERETALRFPAAVRAADQHGQPLSERVAAEAGIEIG